MHLLTIRLLGELCVTDHRGAEVSLTNRRAQALAVYLALRFENGGTLAEAADLIFGEGAGSAHLTDAIADLRYALRLIHNDLVIVENETLRFHPTLVSVDVYEFEALASGSSVSRMRQASELYSGNLLEGYSTGSDKLDDLVTETRLRCWRMGVSILGRLLSAQIKAGWWESAVDTASRLLSLDPSQEVVHRTLMRLQLEQGRPDSALRRYQECADILRRDFGRPPSTETERLHSDIMAALERSPAPREVLRNPIDRPVLVLLVEDDLVSSALVEGYLTEAGYGVVAVADGADALMEIGRRRFDLLVLDINIPTLSGLRLFEIMIQKGIDTPAIFITGIAGAEAEARSLEMGAADFMRKPIRKETLLSRIRTIVQRKMRHTQSAD
jgi:CheY-like chemotaxis protein